MTLETLEKIIELTKKMRDREGQLYDFAIHPELFDIHNELISMLLDELFKTQLELLEYFMYELDFGQKWKEGMYLVNGVDVKLQTVEDLYKEMIFKN